MATSDISKWCYDFLVILIKATNCSTSKTALFLIKNLRKNYQNSLQTQDCVHCCEFYHYLRLDWLIDGNTTKTAWWQKLNNFIHLESNALQNRSPHSPQSASLGLRNLHSDFWPLFVPVAAIVFPFTSSGLTYFFTLAFALPVAREEHHESVYQFLELFFMRSSLFFMSNILSGSADIEVPISVDCEMTAGWKKGKTHKRPSDYIQIPWKKNMPAT